MLKSRKPSLLKNENGTAIIEVIPVIVVIVLLLNFSIGFFGAVHTGILNSIASRNYAFSTFAHRANLTYYRNNRVPGTGATHYEVEHMRFHGIVSESTNSEHFVATKRKIDFFNSNNSVGAAGGVGTHATQVNTVCDFGTLGCSNPRTEVNINPIWIKTSYGICLDAGCGS